MLLFSPRFAATEAGSSNMTNRLSGWQRLWVVLSVLWTLWVGLETLDRWPHDLSYVDENGDLIIDSPAIRYLRSRLLAETPGKAALIALTLWLLPPVALYGAGLAYKWVYRGFRPS